MTFSNSNYQYSYNNICVWSPADTLFRTISRQNRGHMVYGTCIGKQEPRPIKVGGLAYE